MPTEIYYAIGLGLGIGVLAFGAGWLVAAIRRWRKEK